MGCVKSAKYGKKVVSIPQNMEKCLRQDVGGGLTTCMENGLCQKCKVWKKGCVNNTKYGEMFVGCLTCTTCMENGLCQKCEVWKKGCVNNTMYGEMFASRCRGRLTICTSSICF